MQLMRRPGPGVQGLRSGCVATIGTFDGVHLGHRKILDRVREEAEARQLPSLAFSFEPTPGEFFGASAPPARLMRFRDKFETLAALGLDWFFCPPFDRVMENLRPEEFIDRLLVGILRVRHLVIGDDFRFARGRSGAVKDLHAAGDRHGFTVEQVGSVLEDGIRVSSTMIRRALAAGEMETARRLLGRYYRMAGRVVGGAGLGRELGFPTANVNLHRRACPVAGIFAVRVDGLGGDLLPGVASVGTRPTVDGSGEPLLEVHLFDFSHDIYRRQIAVEFIARLRDEEKFADLDAVAARKILNEIR